MLHIRQIPIFKTTIMKESTKNLFSQFLENGGTPNEFWEGRRAAMKQASARSNEHKVEAAAARRDRISDLMERGYSRFEAEEHLRLEALESHDSMGGNPAYRRIRKEPFPRSRASVMTY